MSSVITTDFERWKAQEAALGKPVALNEFVFANVPGLDPSKDISRDEKLPPAGQIVHRQAVNRAGLASEKAVAYSVTLGTDVGDFVFNWIGLINKESGTLAMITHAPEQRKIKTVDGVQGNVLTRSFLLEFNGAAKETQITTSAETWQIDFTARLAGMDEIQRLANRDIYGAAAFFGDGFLVTKAAEQYSVTPGTAYIEGLRGTLEEITTFNNLRDTKIYADFTFQGNLVSKWQTFVKVTTAKTLAHYQDAAGFQHYVAVIAEIDQNGNITDKRVKGTATDRELAELKKDLPDKYQPKGDYQPAGSYASEDDVNSKIDKKSLTDTLGDSKELVIHQKGLTELFTGKHIPAGADLNNYKEPGDFYQNSSDLAASGKNYPGPHAGHLRVEKAAGVIQTFRHYITGQQWQRSFYDNSWTGWLEFSHIRIGKIELSGFTSGELGFGWYLMSNDRYPVESPQGKVLKSLSPMFRSVWKIKESDGMINVPQIQLEDGRTPFFRPVNGTGRQVGSVEQDAQRKITGFLHDVYGGINLGADGVFDKKSVYDADYYASRVQSDLRFKLLGNCVFDSSNVTQTATENRSLNIGMNAVIYLGV
ncbi:phage tail protein [Morganella morganii]|uniref:phage tail-collar fiber domain-containing protein n=1 Tax=Morganella morganii TaxID=582 RepID=UPI00301C9568